MMAVLLALWVSAAAPAAKETVPLRRFALLIGANDGGAQRPALRYAIDDAAAFGRVLSELGGVTGGDSQLLENPTVDAVRAALTRLSADLKALSPLKQRVEVLLYYSGHSDEEGLLLRGALLPYAEIRAWLGSVPAAVRIAILDSCASGTLTRGKGGARAPPFLMDSSTQVHGHAILTSSSETEASQESDRIGGSFFTHALLSAMRGAADGTHDGRVTLNEAYQFTFDETLARTEKTRGGAQHPAYDIQLVGTGDLVMTDLHSSSSTLVLPEALIGRFFVRDERGRLVAELRKFAGRLIELGLEPGTYSMTRELDGVVSEGTFTLAASERVPVEGGQFSVVSREATAKRGAENEPSAYRWVPVELSFLPSIGIGGDARVVNNAAISLLGGRSTRLEGVALSIGGHRADEVMHGAQLSVGFNSAGGSMKGAQLTVGGNVASEGMLGVQNAVGFNWVTDEARGVQLAVGANVAGDLSGVQLSVGANVAMRSLKGMQLSVGFNSAGAASSGTQFTVGLNVAADSFKGAQFSTFGNWAHAQFSGAQVSSGFSYASAISGAQVSLVNVGGDVSGAQVGLINVASTVRGAQVGLLNVAGRVEGESVGLISVVRDGLHRPEVWVEDAALINVGIKLGARHVYALPTFGVVDSKRFAAGIGLGAHLTTETRFSLDVDSIARWVTRFEGNGSTTSFWVNLRVVLDYRFFSHLHAFAGPSLNFAYPLDGHVIARLPQWSVGSGSMWVGGVVGVGF